MRLVRGPIALIATGAVTLAPSPMEGALAPSSIKSRTRASSPGGVRTASSKSFAGVTAPASPAKLLGQRVMVGFPGTTAPAALLARIRAGQVGSVILFGANIASDRQVRLLTSSLQAAARAGGNPPLLIATDQEGGEVKRFASGPPSLSPPQMAAGGRSNAAFRQGSLTGGYLKSRGVNMDLAPVLDVPTSSGAFIWKQGRAFSFSAHTVTEYGTAFALGVQSAGIAATGKDFPGLGSAATDTDFARVEAHPSVAQRAAALTPYESLIPRGLDAVMVTTAGFPAINPNGIPATFSRRVIGGLLRGRLGFRGVVITDALGVPTGHSEITAGVLAASAGADILLYTDSANGELRALESALRAGHITRAEADASYERIVALKRELSG